MIEYSCPNCGQRYSLGDEWGGRQARCQKCNNVIQVPAPAPGVAAVAPAFPAAPAAFAPPPASYATSGGLQPITTGMAQSLRDTRPWVLFLSILGFIGCGFIVLAAFAMMAAGARFGPFRGIGPIFGFIYLAAGLLYFFPAFFLLKYSGGIRKFMDSGQAADMESALGSQKSFWKFVGILTLVVLCIYLVSLLVFVLAAASR